jgi:hypothetical protein
MPRQSARAIALLRQARDLLESKGLVQRSQSHCGNSQMEQAGKMASVAAQTRQELFVGTIDGIDRAAKKIQLVQDLLRPPILFAAVFVQFLFAEILHDLAFSPRRLINATLLHMMALERRKTLGQFSIAQRARFFRKNTKLEFRRRGSPREHFLARIPCRRSFAHSRRDFLAKAHQHCRDCKQPQSFQPLVTNA